MQTLSTNMCCFRPIRNWWTVLCGLLMVTLVTVSAPLHAQASTPAPSATTPLKMEIGPDISFEQIPLDSSVWII